LGYALLFLGAGWLARLLALPPRPSMWLVAAEGLPFFVLSSLWLSRSRADSWRAFVTRNADWHALALVLLVALGVQLEDAHGVTTDGVIYFSQLRSVIFDGDLDVAAEFAFLGQPPRPSHVVPIGPTLVWLPLYLVVAGVDWLGRTMSLWQGPPDPAGAGLTLPYVRAALLSSFGIGTIGLAVLHGHLRQAADRAVALATTLLIFGATPLVWYMVYEPSMTHAASFGFVALFVVAAVAWTSTAISRRRALMLGALLGLAFITRPQEAVFALLPAVLLLGSAAPLRERIRTAARLAGWALAGSAGFLVLQAVHSAVLFGRERFALVGANGYLDVVNSRWADTLWSSWHGFLSWTPVAYVALVGTLFLLRKHRAWAVATLGIVLVMAWVNGSTADWAAGWSFGGRRFTSCLVLLAPGLALVIDSLVRRPMLVVAGLGVVAITWNQLLLAQYRTNRIRAEAPIGFGQIVRQQADLATEPPFVYPFAFPANAWFAWRTGLPMDRYDLLGPERFAGSIDVSMETDAARYLLDGWGARGTESWGPLRWIDGARAELVLPLDRSPDAPATLLVQARSRRLQPPVPVTLRLSIEGTPIGTFTPSDNEPAVSSLAIPPGTVAWRRGFHRIVIEKDGAAPVAIYRLALQ
jgi:hypothetical protein